MSEHNLSNPAEWAGLWVRERHEKSSRSSEVIVGLWHQVKSVGPEIAPVCGLPRHMRHTIGWPSGGLRLELANTHGSSYFTLPGLTCPNCSQLTVGEREVFQDADLIEAIADRVIERMREPEKPDVQP